MNNTNPNPTESTGFAPYTLAFAEDYETEDAEVAFSPQLIPGTSFDDSDDDDAAMYTPSPPSYRHALGVFTTQPTLNFSDMTMNMGFLDASPSASAPTFVLDKALMPASKPKPKTAASPLSPSSYASTVEVPQKLASVFDAVHPAFTSHSSPSAILDALKRSLASLRCEVEADAKNPWSLRVSALVVAEELRFRVHVAQLPTSAYEVEFVLEMGDPARFFELQECVRARSSEIDDDACLALLSTELDAWMDEEQEVQGRRFRLQTQDAADLLQDLACDHLDVDSLYEVAKTVKNHCRHRRNRALLLQVDRKALLSGLRWMLADNQEIARYALFILQQYAHDAESCGLLLATPFERSDFALLLEDALARHGDEFSATPRFGARSIPGMVQSLHQSALFA